ncbi:MAG: YbaN family protein [Devosiaceae bacterium]
MRALIIMRAYSLLGLVLLSVGVIGLWVPVLPTTVFIIGAASCFARSSPRLHGYLIHHPTFGPTLRNWEAHGAISKHGKATALFGMGLGMALVVVFVDEPLWLGLAAITLLASAWYVMSRPLPPVEQIIDEANARRMRAMNDDRPG